MMHNNLSHLILRLVFLSQIPVSFAKEKNHTEEATIPHSSTTPSTTQFELRQKLEQVFGQNLPKPYRKTSKSSESSSHPEEFETVEDEFLEDKTTKKSVVALPGEETKTNVSVTSGTKFPILIPNEKDTVIEIGGSVISSGEEDQGYYESTEYGNVNSSEKIRTKGRISTSAHFRRTCGDKMEKCEVGEGGRPAFINFVRNPNYCRCDKGVCDQYGDCCWTIAVTLLYRNPWKCHVVQNQQNVWALMISKCSNQYKSSPGADANLITSCESPLTIPASKQYSHLHDIPVVSNVTRQIYRNIYCSQCNQVLPEEMVKLRVFLRCSKQFNSSQEREEFVRKAKYVRGKRMWIQDDDVDGNATNSSTTACGPWSPDLDLRLLSQTVPGVRYCRENVIDKCPKDYAKKYPLVAALCNSYTQLVESRPGFLFKNPHCAQCYGLNSKWDLRCLKEGIGVKIPSAPPRGKITPGAAGASLDSAGLSLLFDFDLTSGGNYVGYESTCPGDTMWDFLRQKCTATMCGKDYEVDNHGDGRCRPKHELENVGSSSTDGEKLNNTEKSNVTFGENLTPENSTSACFVLIVHDSEYTILPNSSVLVTTGPSTQKLFHPGEYDMWNESSIYICARDLSSSFRQRFSPLLNYLSLSALGCSVFFSVLHILLFITLPKMRNLPGKNLFCLSISLLISQFLLLAFLTSKVHVICMTVSVFMHYFFLSSFFWMNVMSFDIWRTFSSQFMTRHSSSGNGGLFLKYCAWGWGFPFIIVAISVSIDFLFAELHSLETSLQKIRPLYGHNNLCWIGQGFALFLFFALPAVILIVLNILLFGWTSKAILEQSRDTQKVFNGDHKNASKKDKEKGTRGHEQCSRRTSTSSEAEVQRMKLYMKLGVIMGVTWILGFLSGISEWEWLWYAFVLVNGLQGTFIFFGFDAKPKVWSMLMEKLGCGGGERGNGNVGDGREGIERNRRSTTDATNTTTTTSTRDWRRDTTSSTASGGIMRGRNNRESISQTLPV